MNISGYNFKNKELLKIALTHSSYANENHCKCNERFEFLGDSVLSIIISDYLFRHMPDVNEGELSKIRAALVCEQSLAEMSRKLDIGKNLLLGKGEEAMGGRTRASILSDAFEAVLAAIYLDSGLEEAEKWVINLMTPSLKLAIKGKLNHDYKTLLQEEVQKNAGKVSYNVIAEKGPDHHKDFEVEVLINGKRVASALGVNKKDAEQSAARLALKGMGYEVL